MRKPGFPYAKTKTQISFPVTAKLISAFVFAVQSLYYLNPKFQASSHLQWLYSQIVWDLVGNPKTGFLTTRLKYQKYVTCINGRLRSALALKPPTLMAGFEKPGYLTIKPNPVGFSALTRILLGKPGEYL